MLVFKSSKTIKLITTCIHSATTFHLSKSYRVSFLVIAIGLSCSHTSNVSGQTPLKPPVANLPPPISENGRLPARQIEVASSLQENENSSAVYSNQEPTVGDQDSDPRNALMSGPMHEAFMEVYEADPQPNAIVSKEPPEPINELPPEFKPDGLNVQWIPGYWGWDFEKSDFVWVSGLWRDVPPDRKWIPGYWQKVDEGFRWISGYWQNETEESIEYLPEPPQNIDTGPSTPAPGDEHFYVPGNWVMHQSAYRWSPGYWQSNVANWVWVPARYIWCPNGYVFRPGYWDRIIDQRGVVFAPVYYSTPYYRSVGYRYTPRFAINVGVRLLPHLFVNLRHGHYYYGDWHGIAYRRHGIFPWVNAHRHYKRFYDPLFAYYSSPSRRYANRNSYSWARDRHYQIALHGNLRPGRTFADHGRRNRISGSVNFQNGAVSLGVRYSDYVKNSGRKNGAPVNGKGATHSPHYYREFRHLSQNDIQRETKRTQPINDVRSARRAHEVRSKGSGIATNRGRSAKPIERLNIERFGNQGRNPNSRDRMENNASRFAKRGRSASPENSNRGKMSNPSNRSSNPGSSLGSGSSKQPSSNRGIVGKSGRAGNQTRSSAGKSPAPRQRAIPSSKPTRNSADSNRGLGRSSSPGKSSGSAGGRSASSGRSSGTSVYGNSGPPSFKGSSNFGGNRGASSLYGGNNSGRSGSSGVRSGSSSIRSGSSGIRSGSSSIRSGSSGVRSGSSGIRSGSSSIRSGSSGIRSGSSSIRSGSSSIRSGSSGIRSGSSGIRSGSSSIRSGSSGGRSGSSGIRSGGSRGGRSGGGGGRRKNT